MIHSFCLVVNGGMVGLLVVLQKEKNAGNLECDDNPDRREKTCLTGFVSPNFHTENYSRGAANKRKKEV